MRRAARTKIHLTTNERNNTSTENYSVAFARLFALAQIFIISTVGPQRCPANLDGWVCGYVQHDEPLKFHVARLRSSSDDSIRSNSRRITRYKTENTYDRCYNMIGPAVGVKIPEKLAFDAQV